MATDFNNFELRSELDKEAFDILNLGNSDLVFGGSSKQEAEIFGKDISASDAPRVGAYLGGVALANLKVQDQRAERFARIRSLQDEILQRQEAQLARDRMAQDESQFSRQESRLSTNAAENRAVDRARISATLSGQASQRQIAAADRNATLLKAQSGLTKDEIRQDNISAILNDDPDINISEFRGVSDEALEAKARSVREANNLKQQLSASGVPITKESRSGSQIPLSLLELRQQADALQTARTAPRRIETTPRPIETATPATEVQQLSTALEKRGVDTQGLTLSQLQQEANRLIRDRQAARNPPAVLSRPGQ